MAADDVLPLTRRVLAAAALLALAACDYAASLSNPLIGRWAVEAPGAAFNLGTYEFYRSSMRALGLEQAVDYQVRGDTVRVLPRGFGPQLEVRLVDGDTAQLGSPLTGGLVTLRRLR